MNVDTLASLLVRYSVAVRAGEIVSVNGPAEGAPLADALCLEILRAGGHPVVLLRSEAHDELLTAHGSDEQLAFVDPLANRAVEVADATIDLLPAPARPMHADPGRLSLLHRARRPLVERFLRRAADGTLRWTATLFPRSAGREYEDALIRAMGLDRPDPIAYWQELHARQHRLIDTLSSAQELRLVVPPGTDVRVGIGSCRWHNGTGHQNMPDGEVWAAPVPDSTEGTVTFDVPVVVAGTRISNAQLTFRAGQVVHATAAEGEAFLRALLDREADARQLAEVALGCNYALERPLDHPLLDEKRGGTFHLALGRSGRHTPAVVHVDLIGDLRAGGRVEVDGRLLSQNGRFIDPSWPQPME